jgi:uncharacterized protein (DUF488 family)
VFRQIIYRFSTQFVENFSKWPTFLMYSGILTIGHSTRTLEAFIALLQEGKAEWIADVRSIPRSRHNPQFNDDTLPERLFVAGIGYSHIAGLGGFRKPRADSPNTHWKNAGFRGYADYMQTARFTESLEVLLELARKQRAAVMCAEAVPWRCHRSLIADALVVHGVRVTHLLAPGERIEHILTAGARVDGGLITYP